MITAKPSPKEAYHIGSESISYDERTKVINHFDTFCIFDEMGNIHPQGKKAQGIFYKGTRYINQLELRLAEQKAVLLSSSIKQDNEVLAVDLTNPDLNECRIKENTIYIGREQFIRNGLYYEEIQIANYGLEECIFDLSLLFGADFSDIFEIRGTQRHVKVSKPKLSFTDKNISFDYTGLDDIHRRTEVVFEEQVVCTIHKNTVLFPIKLEPKQKTKLNYSIHFKCLKKSVAMPDEKVPVYGDLKKGIQRELGKSNALFADISSSNEKFNNWITRSKADIQSLLAETPYGKYPYAGIPWYNTVFGRDGIITAMEVLWLAPEIAKDVLIFLSYRQATEKNESNDAEPGKIIHEMRSGEMANTGEVPFKEYYGTIDATPLYLMLAGMYYEHTNDLETIKHIWIHIKTAVEWIDKYGDMDGDSFVEYNNSSKKGLTNQGWKDSADSIMYENGELCEGPIALCEVQGYVYAAKKYVSAMAKALKENAYADALGEAAHELKKKFEAAFWVEALGTYALALDGRKKPCRVVASNAGHCLFTGIADAHHANKIAQRLTDENMFSGWGIRTLACNEVRYNPMSYHNGSVWPHDNAIIAYGLSKYGKSQEVLKIMQGLFDSSLYIELHRLPELFCGFDRRKNEGPTAYPVACSPQAWAVGAVFLLLQACLRIEIRGKDKTVFFNKPQLPLFLEKLTIRHLRLADNYCDFEVYRHAYGVSFHILHKPDDWELIIKK